MKKIKPRSQPCPTCPYRLDAPPGLWAEEEYVKLPLYDGTTAAQLLQGAINVFCCHTEPCKLCAGWVGCHDMRHNLSIRMRKDIDIEAVMRFKTKVPLHPSGKAAAAHGMKAIDNPPPKTLVAMEKVKKFRVVREYEKKKACR